MYYRTLTHTVDPPRRGEGGAARLRLHPDGDTVKTKDISPGSRAVVKPRGPGLGSSSPTLTTTSGLVSFPIDVGVTWCLLIVKSTHSHPVAFQTKTFGFSLVCAVVRCNSNRPGIHPQNFGLVHSQHLLNIFFSPMPSIKAFTVATVAQISDIQ